MKIDITKIVLFFLVIAVIVLGYGIFRTKKYEDSPNSIANQIALQELAKDKVNLQKQLDDKTKQYDNLMQEAKENEVLIATKDNEIKTLKKRLYEKIKYVSNLDDSSSFVLFSGWLTD